MGRNPDLIGLVPVSKSAEDTIERMSFELSAFLLWNVNVAAGTEDTEGRDIRFLVIEYLIGC